MANLIHQQWSFASVVVLLLLVSNGIIVESVSFQRMFVFGDSLVDNGNNNYLRSMARSNYYPYGIDFTNNVATGRFSNGKTFVDLLGELLGVPTSLPFASPSTIGVDLFAGVNYASAAAGILDETGQHYGQRHSLSQQVLNFEKTLDQLRTITKGGNLTEVLRGSLAVLVFGSNDYINNYLMPSLYPSSSDYNPVEFANHLLERYTRQLVALYSLGLRRFLIGGIGPLGCIPNQRASSKSPDRCVDTVNQMLGTFNVGLRSLVDKLNRNPAGAIFVYGNTYGVVGDILNNPAKFGFSVVDKACCGIGRNQGQITCLPYAFPCLNRNEYVFWDAFHPTQAVDVILAQRSFYGSTTDCYPINVQQMTLIAS